MTRDKVEAVLLDMERRAEIAAQAAPSARRKVRWIREDLASISRLMENGRDPADAADDLLLAQWWLAVAETEAGL